MFYTFLYPLHTELSFLNVFRYITFRTVYALLTALAICLVFGPAIIRALKRHEIAQGVRVHGPRSQMEKTSTPTMGGFMILLSIFVSTLLWADLQNPYIWLVLLTTVSFGVIGFWDDSLKIRKKQAQGLPPRFKFLLQVLVGLGVGLALYQFPAYSSQLSVPFFKNFHPDLGWWYIGFAALVIVGASNAVNLTDGLDGLAIGPVIIATLAFMIVVYVTGHMKFANYLLIPFIQGTGELSIFCGAMIGAGLGFLWFNAYPASVFMGDVGSLPLGAALGSIAVIAKHELLLILIGGVFVIEALSVIFQVVSYKSRGKRILLMAPIHHHFELKGLSEPKVVMRFWIVAIILALLSLSALKLR